MWLKNGVCPHRRSQRRAGNVNPLMFTVFRQMIRALTYPARHFAFSSWPLYYSRLTSFHAAKIFTQQCWTFLLNCCLCDGWLATKNTKTHEKSVPTIAVSSRDQRTKPFVAFAFFPWPSAVGCGRSPRRVFCGADCDVYH